MRRAKPVKIGLHRDGHHQYTWNEGTKKPGVTSIVGVNDKSGPLIYWATEQTATSALRHIEDYAKLIAAGGFDLALGNLMQVATTERDRTADIGIRVHNYAELHGKGLPLPETVLPSDELRIQSYMRWVEKNKPVFIATEFMVYSEAEEYGGTGDVIWHIDCDEHDECSWIVDYKTGKGIYDTTALQLSGLEQADFIGFPNDPTKYPIPKFKHHGVLHVRDDEAELVPYSVTEREWEAFKALRLVHRWNKERGPLIKPKQA